MRIDLSQIKSINALASSLKGMGELRVSEGTNAAGDKVTFLRERTLGETIRDFFGINAASRQQHAANALASIEKILTSNRPTGRDKTDHLQAIQNIRTVVFQRNHFTGNAIAAQVDKYVEAKKVEPLEDGMVAASVKAKSGINLMSVSPMRVVADNAVLRSTTVMTTLLANPELGAVIDRVQGALSLTDTNRNRVRAQGGLKEQFSLPGAGLLASSIVVMPDLKPTTDTGGEPAIEPDQLKLMYAQTLKGKSGTLVMEPFPDQFTRDQMGTWSSYSDKGLKMMMEAIIDAVTEAANNKKKLHVTIACEDNVLIARLKSSYATQQKTFMLEDEIDSDSDNEELTLDPAVVAKAQAKASEDTSESTSDDDDGAGVGKWVHER